MRYEAIELGSDWLVLDHSHPEAKPAEFAHENEAKLSAHIWNLLTEPDPLVVKP